MVIRSILRLERDFDLGCGILLLVVRRRTLIRIVVVVTSIAMSFAALCLLTRDRKDPATNIAYQAWRFHLAPFSPRYADALARDGSRWIGMPIEDFRRKVGAIYEGMSFPAASYRGEAARIHCEDKPNEAYYWFDDNQNGWSRCVVTDNGLVAGFILIKG